MNDANIIELQIKLNMVLNLKYPCEVIFIGRTKIRLSM